MNHKNQRDAANPAGETSWLSLRAVGQLLGISLDTVGRLVRAGSLHAVDLSPDHRRPRHKPLWRIHRESLQEFLRVLERQAANKKGGPARRSATVPDLLG